MRKYITTKRMSRFTDDELSDMVQVYSSTRSLKQAADKYGIGQGTLKDFLNNNNIPTLSHRDYYNEIYPVVHKNRDRIIQLYTIDGKSISIIGKEFGVSGAVISAFLRKSKIPVHTPKHQKLLKQNIEVIKNSVREKATFVDTAKQLGCSPDSIATFCQNNSIEYERNKEKVSLPETSDVIDTIRTMLHNKALLSEVGEKFNVSGQCVSTYCKKHNIPHVDGATRCRENGIKSVLSRYRKKKYILPSGKEILLQGYEPQFLDYVFKNTSLAENDIDYSYRVISYKDHTGKHRRYVPDFYIPKFNLIVEVKSWWVLDRQTVENFEAKKAATISAGYKFVTVLDEDYTDFESCIQ